MPIFDFACSNKKCNLVVEELTKFDVTMINCPSCGQKADKQVSKPRGIQIDARRMKIKVH